jgi:inhibitor of cysteine peptidase
VRWLLLAVLLGVVCCQPRAYAATKVVTEADKGATVHLRAGDALEVRLKSNPSTGFLWYVEPKSTALLKLAGQSQTEPAGTAVGRPIVQFFRFQTEKQGDGILLLHYVRLWEKPAPGETQFELRVVIE